MKKILFLAFGLLVLFACNQPKNPLYKEVMKIHDDVMPHTGDIVKLSRTLKKKKDNFPEEQRAMVDQTIQELDAAEEAMMDWMSKFDSKRDEEAYLQGEKDKIQKVSDQMYASIEKAKKLIGND